MHDRCFDHWWIEIQIGWTSIESKFLIAGFILFPFIFYIVFHCLHFIIAIFFIFQSSFLLDNIIFSPCCFRLILLSFFLQCFLKYICIHFSLVKIPLDRLPSFSWRIYIGFHFYFAFSSLHLLNLFFINLLAFQKPFFSILWLIPTFQIPFAFYDISYLISESDFLFHFKVFQHILICFHYLEVCFLSFPHFNRVFVFQEFSRFHILFIFYRLFWVSWFPIFSSNSPNGLKFSILNLCNFSLSSFSVSSFIKFFPRSNLWRFPLCNNSQLFQLISLSVVSRIRFCGKMTLIRMSSAKLCKLTFFTTKLRSKMHQSSTFNMEERMIKLGRILPSISVCLLFRYSVKVT